MNVQRLNSISNSLFAYKTNTADVIKLNGANGKVRNLNRDEIISGCRLATLEYFGKLSETDKENVVKFNSKLGEKYNSFQKGIWEDTVLYCAALANKTVGIEPYTSMEQVSADRSLYKNETFWKALAYISQEVITPLFPEVIPAATEKLIDWGANTRRGESRIVEIGSNDFFVFDDDSWGSVSSKPYQYLYKAQIAITPKPYTAKTKIKWYQDIVGGEAGRYFEAFMRGAYGKMYAVIISKFKTALGNAKYMPEGFKFDSYSQDNWNNAIMLLEAVNGVRRDQIMALGNLSSLSKVLPTVGTPAVAAGIQGMIGEEWVRNGFLANVAGVDLIESSLGVVPGTQNYNPKFIGLDDKIYLMAKVGRAPMVGAMAEGSPITIDFTPRETADMTIDISETIVFDIAAAFSSKMVEITL
jgi:hypothetical protein|nr:MAG TPA: hypothetical protein [Caudoviricetes sp.]